MNSITEKTKKYEKNEYIPLLSTEYDNFIEELNHQILCSYYEWYNGIDCNYFIDEDDENMFCCIMEDEPYSTNELPFDYYCKQTNGIYCYNDLTNYKDESYTIRKFAMFSNINGYGKKYKNNYDISMYPISVRNDYIKFYLKQLLSSKDHYDIRKGRYWLFPHQLKWFYNIPFEKSDKPGREDHPKFYLDLFESDHYIRKEYSQQIKIKLYKMVSNEKLNLTQNTIVNKTNIDCWKLICDFVCMF